jgi:membrane associated rhomboid family serine protease
LNPGISWQAHIGGLVVGGAVAAIYAATRKAEQKGMQITGLAILIAVLVGLSVYQAGVYGLL